ncbi:hypothetical protein [Pseudomonas sp. S49]|uniref:hypothetical protein n=1 Tax=Pseudomonas sp. S49 TaxID=1573720 RepID=UPI00132F0A51|nr:hypothetical protein [Pseudomonas sp. S49]QHF52557.1 hypothetical protein PspS49_23995 [Pseudomonas sp. S49]
MTGEDIKYKGWGIREHLENLPHTTRYQLVYPWGLLGGFFPTLIAAQREIVLQLERQSQEARSLSIPPLHLLR